MTATMSNAIIVYQELNVQIIGTKPQISNARKIMIWHSLRNYQTLHMVLTKEVIMAAMSVARVELVTMAYSIA